MRYLLYRFILVFPTGSNGIFILKLKIPGGRMNVHHLTELEHRVPVVFEKLISRSKEITGGGLCVHPPGHA
jgi:hypothetical protein